MINALFVVFFKVNAEHLVLKFLVINSKLNFNARLTLPPILRENLITVSSCIRMRMQIKNKLLN